MSPTGIWDIIVPEAATNRVKNPIAYSATSLTAIAGGTVTRVTTYSYYGPACNRLVTAADNDGGSMALTACANAIHYMTLRIHTASDITPMFDCSLDNSTFITPTLLSTEGSWWVYGCQIPAAQANGSTTLYIQQNGAGNNDIYIGHAQVEQNTYPTTPITGDLAGFIGGYSWAGSPHASASTRSSQERSGGRVVDLLETYKVKVRWASGIGMPPATHHIQGQALLPGAQFLGAKVQPRALDLTAIMGDTCTPAATHSVRKDLIDALKLDLVSGAQPVKLRYRGALSTKPVEFNAIYDTGLEFNIGSDDYETAGVRLICYDPYAYEVGEASFALTTQTANADADYIMRRTSAGAWINCGTGANDVVDCVVTGPDGALYAGGSFTTLNGTTVNYIGKSTDGGLTWASCGGTSCDNAVSTIVFDAAGTMYVGGAFTKSPTNVTVNRMMKSTDYGATWATVGGTSCDQRVDVIAISKTGVIFAGGIFTKSPDNVTVNYLMKSADGGATWTTCGGTSCDAGVLAILFDNSNNIYAGGSMTKSPDNTTVNYVMKSTNGGTVWTAMGGTSCDAAVWAMEINSKGWLYAGGAFTKSPTNVTVNRIMVWNGSIWQPVGGTNCDNTVASLAIDKKGNLWAGGIFTTIGGLALADHLAIWNGYTWTQPNIDLPGNPTVYTINFSSDDAMNVGYSTSGTANTSTLNSITNNGTARAYPVVHIKRTGGTSATVEWLKNETTGKTIFLNYALQSGEELILDFRLGQRKVTSSYYGLTWRAVLRGSEFSDFYLAPGVNSISAYVNQVGSPTMSQWMCWTTTHESADGAAA